MTKETIDLQTLEPEQIFLLGYDTCLSFLNTLPRQISGIASDDDDVSNEEAEALVKAFREIIEQASAFLENQKKRFIIIEEAEE